jgi:heme exporter protein CcmD
MPDFGSYAFYIIGAYAVAGISLAALLLATLVDLRALARKLAEIEKS